MMPFTIELDTLQAKKGGITCVISHNYAKTKFDLFDSFSLEKTWAFHNVAMLIKSVFNKDKNNYYYNIFLEKCSYK